MDAWALTDADAKMGRPPAFASTAAAQRGRKRGPRESTFLGLKFRMTLPGCREHMSLHYIARLRVSLPHQYTDF